MKAKLGKARSHVHDKKPLEVTAGGGSRRYVHPGFLRDGRPYVDSQTAWLEVRSGGVEITLFTTSAELRKLAAECLAAADQVDHAPTTACPGGCGFGCKRAAAGGAP